jgi:FecR protein
MPDAARFKMMLNFTAPLFKRAAKALLGATVAASTLWATAAWADPPGRVGRVAQTEGTVWMQDDARGEWVPATRNRPLTVGDRLSLQTGAHAIVHIGSGTLRLDGDTELEVAQMNDRVVRLHLHAGTAALQLPINDSAREFEITTAEGRTVALTRSHFRVDRHHNTSIVTAWDGSVRFESSDSALDIQRGQRAEFWFEGGRTSYSYGQVGRDAFTDWVVASERRESSVAARYVSPEMTGAYELDRHGDWDQHPQYGAVWLPRGVASDWAPYRYGRWSYVSPWGWTWVDDASWGFAPFHYGRWVHWGGRWGWTPGTYVARPTYAPALVAWYGGPNLSVTVSSGPHVGWVPLAPFETFSPWYTTSAVYVTYINVVPWRGVRGYNDHYHQRNPGYHHHNHGNRQVAGGFTVVPQGVLTDRRPIRQDVITPQQAAVWRGGDAQRGGAATAAPGAPSGRGPDASGGMAARTDDRRVQGVGAASVVPAFVPPALSTTRVAVPDQAPGSNRAVPWGRPAPLVAATAPTANPNAVPNGMVRGAPGVNANAAVNNAPPVVNAAPAITTRDGRIVPNDSRDARPQVGDVRSTPGVQQPAPQMRPAPTWTNDGVNGGVNNGRAAPGSPAAPRDYAPAVRQDAPVMQQQPQPEVRMPPRMERSDRPMVQDAPVRVAPPPAMAPPPVMAPRPQPQPQMQPPQMQTPQRPAPQAQPTPQVRQPNPKDDDDNRSRRGPGQQRER